MRGLIAVVFLIAATSLAAADTFSSKQIRAGVSSEKTQIEQQAWWDKEMSGKLMDFTGTIKDVEKGTFSGYWVTLNLGNNVRALCGMSSQWAEIVTKFKKGQKYTCRGYVSETWSDFYGVAFKVNAG